MKERGYMSTNSVVAYLRSDGSIVSSYVHYDGYETGVGMTLLEHYNSDERDPCRFGWGILLKSE